MAVVYFILLYLVFFQSLLPTSFAKNDSNAIGNEELPSVLTRLTQLEIESKEQKQTIKFLEYKVERHEVVIEKLEKKLKNSPLATESSSHFSENQHVDVEAILSSSSTSSDNRGKRPARLLPYSILRGPKNQSNYEPQHPSSCQDLNDFGHTVNGFYLVKNKNKLSANNLNQLQMVYCDFKNPMFSASAIHETTMGYVDVKSSTEPTKKEQGIHFYSNKGCKSSNANGIIPFNLVKINIGGGFNSSNGVFTAPKPGTYKFMFNAIKEVTTIDALNVFLRVNEKGRGEGITPLGFHPHSIVIHAMLKLKKGDRVDLYKTGGRLGCNTNDPNSHFSGSLLLED